MTSIVRMNLLCFSVASNIQKRYGDGHVFCPDKILVLRYIVLVAHMELVACSWGPHMQLFTAVLTLHTFQYFSWVLHYINCYLVVAVSYLNTCSVELPVMSTINDVPKLQI